MTIRIALALGSLLVGCSEPTRKPKASADSAFAALQQRGVVAMGVDQYTSTHVFEPLADGGRIVLQRDSADAVGTATIRAHLHEIATRFAAGDFTIPGVVHAQTVPGTVEMRAHRRLLRYAFDALPNGGQVRIITSDSAALAAVRAFLQFQRMDHRADGHDHR